MKFERDWEKWKLRERERDDSKLIDYEQFKIGSKVIDKEITKALNLNTKPLRVQIKDHNHWKHWSKKSSKHNPIATNNSHTNRELQTHILQAESHNHWEC